MRLYVYLTSDGANALAEAPPGRNPHIYSWHFVVRTELLEDPTYRFLHEFDMPALRRHEVTRQAVAGIDKEIQQAYASAEQRVQALREQKEKLLAIEYSPPKGDIFGLWPDGFMCPKEEVEAALRIRSDDFEWVEVLTYTEDGSPGTWRSA